MFGSVEFTIDSVPSGFCVERLNLAIQESLDLLTCATGGEVVSDVLVMVAFHFRFWEIGNTSAMSF
jgi:hypothetical protein